MCADVSLSCWFTRAAFGLITAFTLKPRFVSVLRDAASLPHFKSTYFILYSLIKHLMHITLQAKKYFITCNTYNVTQTHNLQDEFQNVLEECVCVSAPAATKQLFQQEFILNS